MVLSGLVLSGLVLSGLVLSGLVLSGMVLSETTNVPPPSISAAAPIPLSAFPQPSITLGVAQAAGGCPAASSPSRHTARTSGTPGR